MKHLIYITFVTITLALCGAAFWYAKEFRSQAGEAAGFGISPTYVDFSTLKPGDSAEGSIRVMRGSADGREKVTARILDEELRKWITILPAETITMEEGVQEARFTLRLRVPANAYSGIYDDVIYLAQQKGASDTGVSIRLGARADIRLAVSGGLVRPPRVEGTEPLELAEGELADRLEGAFIIRSQARGQIYYIHPYNKKIARITGTTTFAQLINDASRPIADELLSHIEADLKAMHGTDSDKDGLPDAWEKSLGTDPKDKDSDDDKFDDLAELRSGHSPLGKERLAYDQELADNLRGFLLKQEESANEIWYVRLSDGKRVLIDPKNYLESVKLLYIGISEKDFAKIWKE